ncbi:ATP-dependent DNA ligase [Christensenellaceae bacterium]|nr:ATP-dependent DNA ligase [Christensenellaceae bacterium]BDF61853.1 ATP-dependent DNA ligase [Christensenellaceae bacterium]
MMDIFDERSAKPMLIGKTGEAFDSKDYIFELKLDGTRCLAYLGHDTVLMNKRGVLQIPKMPELSMIHEQIKKKCILDGELIVSVNDKPDFSKIQQRSLMSNHRKIQRLSQEHPATFVVYDILYYDTKQVTDKPLMQRKELIYRNLTESPRMSISRFIETQGIALFDAAKKEALEGIVGKLKDSKYYMGKRTSDWIKIKNLADDDFIICGYITKTAHVTSLILGQYNNKGEIVYKGNVVLGISRSDYDIISAYPKISYNPITGKIPSEADNAVWIKPELVCTIKYMRRTNGGLQQPVYKGLREDKSALEVKE